MAFVGMLDQLQLSHIFKHIQLCEQTGLLTIARGEQRIGLYFQQGQLIYLEPLPLSTPLKQRLFHIGKLSQRDLQEAELAMSTMRNDLLPPRAHCGEIQMALALREPG